MNNITRKIIQEVKKKNKDVEVISISVGNDGVEEDNSFHICTSDDMHPYECNHNKTCIHCAKRKTKEHNPKTCALCLYDQQVEV